MWASSLISAASGHDFFEISISMQSRSRCNLATVTEMTRDRDFHLLILSARPFPRAVFDGESFGAIPRRRFSRVWRLQLGQKTLFCNLNAASSLQRRPLGLSTTRPPVNWYAVPRAYASRHALRHLFRDERIWSFTSCNMRNTYANLT